MRTLYRYETSFGNLICLERWNDHYEVWNRNTDVGDIQMYSGDLMGAMKIADRVIAMQEWN